MKWYCDDCAPERIAGQPNPCPACCGFTAIDEDIRGQIGEAAIALSDSPFMDTARAMFPDLDAHMTVLEKVAAGERS